MLQPHEIFARMPAPVAEQLLSHLFEKEKRLYTATIDSLAKQRKLRPVFVERKPRPQRHAWLRETLAKRASDGIAAHLLQIWLVGAHREMLCYFLDLLGIPHDPNGTVSELPPAPPLEKLAPIVGTLLHKYDPAVVAVYLHAFQTFDEHGWSTLADLLGKDPRLQLPAVPSQE